MGKISDLIKSSHPKPANSGTIPSMSKINHCTQLTLEKTSYQPTNALAKGRSNERSNGHYRTEWIQRAPDTTNEQNYNTDMEKFEQECEQEILL